MYNTTLRNVTYLYEYIPVGIHVCTIVRIYEYSY